MLKYILLLALLNLSMQHQIDCETFTDAECKANVGCQYDSMLNICSAVAYRNLGRARTAIPQFAVFDKDEHCGFFTDESSFSAYESFYKSDKPFRSMCNMMNLSKVTIKGVNVNTGMYVIPNGETATEAIFYPQASTGCALLYEKSFYRGKSWLVCGPTKLNGQPIRSIMGGQFALVSLYTAHGKAINGYQRVNYSDPGVGQDGLPDIVSYKKVEYVLIEKYKNYF